MMTNVDSGGVRRNQTLAKQCFISYYIGNNNKPSGDRSEVMETTCFMLVFYFRNVKLVKTCKLSSAPSVKGCRIVFYTIKKQAEQTKGFVLETL